LGGNIEALNMLIDAAPEVYNYNTETVPRLYSSVRGPKADYRWTLEIFRQIRKRNPRIRTKTGMILGLGETIEEVIDWLAELVGAGCQILTMGQYLRPGIHQMPVARYVPPEEFAWLGEIARQIGFQEVAAGPFVRSSYRAGELLQSSMALPTCP
jgi:lipoic acid synthetase